MSDVVEMRLAVLIDADNVAKSDVKAIVGEVAKYGTPVVKRAYGDWASQTLVGWKEVLLEIGAVPVQQYAYTVGKNATDVAMVIDAMDFLHDNCVEGFVLVSSDSDFTPLALRLRESGKKVFGIGEKKTPKPFIKACDKFIYYAEILRSTPSLSPDLKDEHPTQKEKSVLDSTGDSFLAAVMASAPDSEKDVKKAGSDASAPIKKTISSTTVEFLAQCIAELSGDDGCCALSGLGSLVSKKRPDFDSRNYGYSQLSKLLRSIDRFKVTGSGSSLRVKDKRANG